MKKDVNVPLILGRPLLVTNKALIDVQLEDLIRRIWNEQVAFVVSKALKFLLETNLCGKINALDPLANDLLQQADCEEKNDACIMNLKENKKGEMNVDVYKVKGLNCSVEKSKCNQLAWWLHLDAKEEFSSEIRIFGQAKTKITINHAR